MKKACIFDFDGVIINSVQHWEDAKTQLNKDVYGISIANKLNQLHLMNMDVLHEAAVSFGSPVQASELHRTCNRYAQRIYREAPITEGIDVLIQALLKEGYVLAIVSASPLSWIQIALDRLKHKRAFRLVLSLQDRLDLKHKPSPDGYNAAMKLLGVPAGKSIIIEDSNEGIASAKTAGAFTIGLKQNLVDGYT